MGDHPPSAAAAANNGFKRCRSPPQKKSGEVPLWVLHMINMQYQDCPMHSNSKTAKEINKLDRFCINCLVSFCNQCCANHLTHKYIKIRRYVYRDVINRPDFQKHFDCAGIQGYVTNKNKVLFLKRRGNIQQAKEQQQNTRDRCCIVCNHGLIDSFYCSIQCKVSALKAEEEPSKRKLPRKGIPQRASLF